MSKDELTDFEKRRKLIEGIIFSPDDLNIAILFLIASSTETEPIEVLARSTVVKATINIPETLFMRIFIS